MTKIKGSGPIAQRPGIGDGAAQQQTQSAPNPATLTKVSEQRIQSLPFAAALDNVRGTLAADPFLTSQLDEAGLEALARHVMTFANMSKDVGALVTSFLQGAPAPAGDDFAATGGAETAARAAAQGDALPRSGWGDEAALRAATTRARAALDAQDPGAVNHRTARMEEEGTDPLPLPVIVPLYGVPMPTDWDATAQQIKDGMRDKSLKEAFDGMLADNLLDEQEAQALVDATRDGDVLSGAERKGLNAILNGLQLALTGRAFSVINEHLETQAGGLSLKDNKIKAAFKSMLADFQVDSAEVQSLILLAMDGPGLGKHETEDLKKILDNIRMTDMARIKLQNFVDTGVPEPIIVPMYGVPVPDLTVRIKDRELKAAVDAALADRFIDDDDAQKIIQSAKDGPGLSSTEREDLTRLMTELAPFISTDATNRLNAYLAITDPSPPMPPIVPMYGVPVPGPGGGGVVEPPPDPVIVPMYGVPVPPDGGGGANPGGGGVAPPPVVALYGVAMPTGVDPQ